MSPGPPGRGRSVQPDSGEQTPPALCPPLPSPGSPAMRDMEPKDQQLTVALRIRPLNDTEQEEGATIIAHKVDGGAHGPGRGPEDTLRTHRSREKTFIFDTVFDQHASQGGVYRATTQRLVDGVVSGYNATVFAYGPSGAGKTYTMLGMEAEPGIYLQTLSDLFRAIEQTRGSMDSSVSMSYLEIYNEVIRDLLSPSSGPLDLREDARGSIQVAGITEVSTSNAQEIMQLLTRGNRQRTQEPTAANRTSSRSHAVLQVTVRQQGRGHHLAEGVRVGRLFLVDLAGSERASQTQNRGKRMQEGAHINRSLLALGNCINALSERGGGRTHYVNFRDSKLTRLLKDALGGNSRTVMIAHISPASTAFEESRSTLLYADRAKNIKTRVKRNLLTVSYHLDQDMDVISDLRRQIAHLKSKIERQEQRGSEPGLRDAQVAMPAQDPEDNRLQMSETRAQLAGALQTPPEMRHSLLELEDANVALHVDVSRHLLAIADWERDKTPHRAQDERDEQQAVADAAEDEGGPGAERRSPCCWPRSGKRGPPGSWGARQGPWGEQVAQTLVPQAELERRLASPQRKAAQELEAENTARQAGHLRGGTCWHRGTCSSGASTSTGCCVSGSSGTSGSSFRHECYFVMGRRRVNQQHTFKQRERSRGQSQTRGLWEDAGLPVPAALDERYGLYARALGEGSLDRCCCCTQPRPRPAPCRCVPGTGGDGSPPPEEAHGDQDEGKGPLGGAPFELLETDRPLVFGPPDPAVSPQRPSALRAKPGASRLSPPAGPDLEEVAASTKSIALVAASRRCQAQDREGGSGRSSLHLPEEPAPGSRDTSPADRRRPRASPGRRAPWRGRLGSGGPPASAGAHGRPPPRSIWLRSRRPLHPTSRQSPRASSLLSPRPPRRSPAPTQVRGQQESAAVSVSFTPLLAPSRYIFIDVREEGTGERDRNINDERESLIGCLLHAHWDQACNPGMCPDRESNL
ncbi:hypothetical protein QTO34_016403 [Cnephaeus nilssonii]|uniref:Kinesin-like protein n=1 Tax=Cnephaeus nilssonii TaxID=3371016 RepID=A0AA40I5W5_CNENI|nr:hypothetical protein QTO34_016403 [Eptesicus nilssonii]